MNGRQRLRRTLSVVAAVVVLVTGCGRGSSDTPSEDQEATPQPQLLTTEQAQALAVMRFNNYSAKRIRLAVRAPGTVGIEADVVVDYRVGAAYGSYTVTDAGGEDAPDEATAAEADGAGAIAWSSQLVGTAAVDRVPRPDQWTQRAMDPSRPVDVALAMALSLGSDRPENPVLLQQSDARLLRVEGSGADELLVISGPGAADGTQESRTTYWIDDTGHLERMEARIGSGEPAVFEVVEAEVAEPLPAPVLRALRKDR